MNIELFVTLHRVMASLCACVLYYIISYVCLKQVLLNVKVISKAVHINYTFSILQANQKKRP